MNCLKPHKNIHNFKQTKKITNRKKEKYFINKTKFENKRLRFDSACGGLMGQHPPKEDISKYERGARVCGRLQNFSTTTEKSLRFCSTE